MTQQQETLQQNIIYADIKADDEPTIIESICMQCKKNGKTTILMTKIPMFREIILISFYCDECGFKNNEAQFGGKLNEHAVNLYLKCIKSDDFKRDVIKSEHASVKIPEIDFEIPANKKGTVNTIEGFLQNTIEDLESEQEARKILHPELFIKIAEFIVKVKQLLDGEKFPFTFVLEDPSGNSFIKNPHAPQVDKNLVIQKKFRTKQQLENMGYSVENAQQEVDQQQNSKNKTTKIQGHKVDFSNPYNDDNIRLLKDEAVIFQVPCDSCLHQGETKMCTTTIPFFKEIIVMAFTCNFCGNRSTEVKVGGEMSKQGKLITLHVENEDDLKRDLFKSDTAYVSIPEIEFEMGSGAIGGVYTTVEGLLEKIFDNLKDNNMLFGEGDSADKGFAGSMKKLFDQFDVYKEGNTKFTLIIEDLLENSFIQNPYYPDPDPRCEAKLFNRTKEQDEELGLDMMKTEGYEGEIIEESKEEDEQDIIQQN